MLRSNFKIGFLLLLFSFVVDLGKAQDNTPPALITGQQYFREGNFEKAETFFQKVIKTFPGNKQAYQFLIASYLQQSKAQEAIEASISALERFPGDNWIKWMMGEGYLITKEYTKALQMYLEVQEASSFQQSKLPGQLSNKHLKQKIGGIYRLMGAEALRQQKLEKAIDYYLKVQKYLPNEVKSYTGLAYVYTQKENWQNVITWAEKGLEKFPQHTDLIKLKAQAYYNTNDNKGLLGEYHKLYNHNPDDINIALAYAEILIVNKKLKEALPVYESLMGKYPQERRVYKALIHVNEQFMNIKGKIEVLKRMREQFPDDPEILISMAAAYGSLKEWGQASKVYDTLSHIDSLRFWANKKKAGIYIYQDSLKQADKVYRVMSRDFPKNNDLKLAYGELKEEMEDWKGALALYKTIENAVYKPEVLARLGYVYEKLGKRPKAIESYTLALEKGSGDPMINLHLGSLKLNNDKDQAFSLLKTALTGGLDRIKYLQGTLMGLVEGDQQQLANPIENQRLVDEMEANTGITEEAIGLLSENFEKEQVDDLLTQLVRDYPASARMLYLVGKHYQNHRANREAISWYKKAVKHSPELLEAHLALGSTYENEGQIQKAILAYERVISLDENREEGYEALIRLYRKQEQLAQLWHKWMARYRARPQNEMLKDHLIEALHKDGQYDLSKKIIDEQD